MDLVLYRSKNAPLGIDSELCIYYEADRRGYTGKTTTHITSRHSVPPRAGPTVHCFTAMRSVYTDLMADLSWMDADPWLFSDSHWGHANIRRLCNRPANHEALMAFNWRSVVQPDDHLLHLGDVVWRKGDWALPDRLPGRIHLIPGNHDHSKDIARLQSEYNWDVLPGSFLWNDIWFSHRPERNIPIGLKWNIHGHIHNNGWDFDGIPPGPRINVSVEVTNYMPVKLSDVLAGRAGERQPK